MSGSYYKGKTGYGGFFLDNIRKWIIKECLESGAPYEFFWDVREVVEDLEQDTTWIPEEDEG